MLLVVGCSRCGPKRRPGTRFKSLGLAFRRAASSGFDSRGFRLADGNSPVAFAIFAALFVGLTMSAKTLEKADAPDGNPSVGRMLATFLLMYFAPIGVWVLRSKIIRASEQPPLVV